MRRFLATIIVSLIAIFTIVHFAYAELRVFTIPQGGTGTSTLPSLGEILMGDGTGKYDLVDSSTITPTTSTIQSMFSATSPLTYSSGVFGIPQASSTQSGFLSNTDWGLFNNKLNLDQTFPQSTTGTFNFEKIKLTNTTLLGTPEAGVIERGVDDLYFTLFTSAARKGILLNDGTNLTPGQLCYATTNGRVTGSNNATYNGTDITLVPDSAQFKYTRAYDSGWTKKLDMNLLPSHPSQGYTAFPTGGTEGTFANVSGGILTLTVANPTAMMYYQSNTWSASSTTGYTIEAKMQVLSSSASDRRLNIYFGDGTADGYLAFSNSQIQLSSGQTYVASTADAYHTYRITVLGSVVDVYVDGKLKITGSTAAGGTNVVQFGDQLNSGASVSRWDYFYYDTTQVWTLPATTYQSSPLYYHPTTGVLRRFDSVNSVWKNVVDTTSTIDSFLTTSTAAATYLDLVTASSTYLRITAPSTTLWDTAYSWGNHATAGYFSTSTQVFHNFVSGLQGGDGTNYYHSNQQINTTSSPTFKDVTISDLNNSVAGIFNEIGEPTGFPNTTDSVISYVTSTYTFTIAPSGSSYAYYVDGKKFTTTTPVSITVPTTTGQLNFIYFDSTGAITQTTDTYTFIQNAQIASVYISASGGVIGYERHPVTMDWAGHYYNHKNFGVRYPLTGGGLTGTFNSDNTFSVSAGEIHDEDNIDDIPATTTGRIFYRTGGSSVFDFTDKSTAWYYLSGGNIYYDNAGTITPATSNKYVAYWVFATNDRSSPIYILMGQREDTTLADAQENNLYGNLSLGQLPLPEMKLLYRVIVRNNSPTFTVAATDDYRLSALNGVNAVSTQHNLLSGLDYATAGHTGFAGTGVENTFTVTNTFSGALIGNLTGTSSATFSDATWTLHNSYPAACSAGQFATAIGDTLTCSTESDPVFLAASTSLAYQPIGSYLTSESDPIWASASSSFVRWDASSTTLWSMAYGWGNHALAGYISTTTGNWAGTWQNYNATDFLSSSTAYVASEVDPIFNAASSSLLTATTASSTYLKIVDAASTYLTQANAALTYFTQSAWNAVSSTIVYVTTAFGGDVSGTYDDLQVADDSHAHTSSTISGLVVADFASPNISQWTNDVGFTTTTGEPLWSAASTSVAYLANTQSFTGVNTFTSTTKIYEDINTDPVFGDATSMYLGSNVIPHSATSTGGFRNGRFNVFYGLSSGYSITKGHDNSGFGDNVLSSLTEGQANFAMGSYSQTFLTTGSSNSSLGYQTLTYNVTGNNNTALGYKAGLGSPGISSSSSLYLGYEAGMNTTSSNRLYIANSSTTDPLIYGEFDNNILRFNGTITTGTWQGTPIASAYLQEADSVWTAASSSYLRLDNAVTSTWNQAYSWGDHALAGYVTSTVGDSTTTEVLFNNNGVADGISGLTWDGTDNFFNFTDTFNFVDGATSTEFYQVGDYMHIGGTLLDLSFDSIQIGREKTTQSYGSTVLNDGGVENWNATGVYTPDSWDFQYPGEGEPDLSKTSSSTDKYAGSKAVSLEAYVDIGGGTYASNVLNNTVSFSNGETVQLRTYAKRESGTPDIMVFYAYTDALSNDYYYHFTGAQAGTWVLSTMGPPDEASETLSITSSYTQVSSTQATAPGSGVVDGAIQFVAIGANGEKVLLDSTEILYAGVDEALNGGYENWTQTTSTDLISWTEGLWGTDDAKAGVEQEATIVQSGTYSAKLYRQTSDQPYIEQLKTLTAGHTYRFRYYGRKSDTSSANARSRVSLFDDTKASSTQIYNFTTNAWVSYTPTSTEPTSDYYAQNTPSTTFAQYTIEEFPIPASGKVAIVTWIGGNNTDILYFDNANLDRNIPANTVSLFDFFNTSDVSNIEATDKIFNFYTTGGTDFNWFWMNGSGAFQTDLDYFDFSSKRVKVATPTEDADATTKLYVDTKATTTINYINSIADHLLATTSSIDFTAAIPYKIFTGTASTTIITKVVVIPTTITNFTIAGSFTVGANASNYNDIIDTIQIPDATNKFINATPPTNGIVRVVDNGEDVYASLGVGATADVYRVNIYVFGYTF